MARQVPPNDAAFLAGVRAGIERAERGDLHYRQAFDSFRGVDVVDERVSVPLAHAQRRLAEEETSDRFKELFAEMLTVAIVARGVYGDPPLAEPEVDLYLEQSFSIFNSFRHA